MSKQINTILKKCVYLEIKLIQLTLMLFIGYILEYNLFEVCFEIMKHNSSRTMLRSFSEKLSLCEPLLYIHTYIHKHMEMLQMDVQKKSKDIIIIFLHFCKTKL